MIIPAVSLWASLLMGQLGAIPLGAGITLYPADIVLCLMILVAIFRYGLLTKFWRFRLVRPIVLFAGLGILSLVANFSQYPAHVIGKGSLYLLRWVVYAAAYALVLVSPISAQFWLWWLASFGVALSAIGLVQFVWYPDLRNLWYLGWDPHYYRVFATLLDPNYVGILLVLTIFVFVLLFKRFVQMRKWIALMTGLVGMALLLTYSRSSYLALLVGVGGVIVSLKRWKAGMFLILVLLLAIVYVPRSGGDTLSLDRYDSTVSRIQNWGQTITRIGERPIFGYGLNVVPFLGKEEAIVLPGRSGAGIDSSMLFVAVTTGIVGLISYLWLMLKQITLARRCKDTSLRIIFLVSITAVFVHSLFVNSLFYPWVMVWMWVLSGLVEREERRKER